MLFGGISCSKDAQDDLGSPPLLAVAAVSVSAPEFSDDTRTVLNPTDLIKWYSSDKSYAGLYSPGKGIVKSTYTSTVSDDGFNAVFKFTSSKITSFSSDAARILYPCTAEANGASSFKFSIPAEQSLTSKAGSLSRSGSSACVPMISDAFSVTSSLQDQTSYPYGVEGVAEAGGSMHILSSLVACYIYDSEGTYAAEKVKAVELQSSSTAIGVPQAVELTADNELPVLEGTSQTVKAAFSYSSNYFALNGINSKEQSAPIYLSIIPSEFSGKIVVNTDKGAHIFQFDTPKTFNRAEVKNMYLNLSNAKVQHISIPTVDITNVNRAARDDGNSGCKVTLTIKTDANCTGLYAYVGGTQYSKVADVIKNGEKYVFGDADSEAFQSLGDGIYKYVKSVPSYPTKFYFAVLPIGGGDILGIGKYLSYTGGYSLKTDGNDVADIEEDISAFNN